ncbi:MAG TPA: hypothetical protein PLI73_03625 [Candidatus Cloacimonadota bacterium]|nr:hypothetical protein [Candidatus Cloacimonadota bacterium]
MELDRAIEIISRLADGVNPYTGVILEDDSILQNPDTVRALYKVLEILKKKGSKSSERVHDAPENTGKAWSAEEDAQLINEHEAGISIAEIAASHQRTIWAISSRLIKMGRIKI